MTVSDRWLLPDGVEDILPPLAGQIESLRREVMDTCQRWGYQLVIPPLIEYLESLFTGTGHDLELQTFKLTDQLTGRMMGVRADMTPQAARIDAHTLGQDGITRLCYAGHVLHTRPRHMLTGRTPIQAGCELFGSASESADLEVISLMLEALRVAGLPRVHLDLAHVSIYESLISAAGFDKDTEASVFDAMARKSVPELDELLGDCAEGSGGARLRKLARVNGGVEALDEARSILGGASDALDAALDQLSRVADMLQRDYPEVSLGFDFCELRGYNYHRPGICRLCARPRRLGCQGWSLRRHRQRFRPRPPGDRFQPGYPGPGGPGTALCSASGLCLGTGRCRSCPRAGGRRASGNRHRHSGTA